MTFRRVAGRFALDDHQVAGGMGVVARARDELTGKLVALKRIDASSASASERRFLREATLLSRVSHPGVVQYVAHGTDETGPWLAMEWVDGADLASFILRGRVSVETCIAIGVNLASALAALHANGIIHRDLKPANVLLASEVPPVVKLVDLGIAHDDLAATKLTNTGVTIGTPLYMAPEQLRGDEATAATDVYALGTLLFELCAGRPPFVANAAIAVLGRILLEPAPRLSSLVPSVAATFAATIDACLAKQPAERPTIASIISALEEERSVFAAARTVDAGEGKTIAATVTPANIGTERIAAAVLVVRNVARERIAAALGEHAQWEVLRDGTALALFLDKRSPDAPLVRAIRAALDLERSDSDAALVVCSGRVWRQGQSFVGELFERAANIDAPGAGVYVDATDAGGLRGRFDVSGEGVCRVSELSVDENPRVAGLNTPTVGRQAELAQLDALVTSAIENAAPRVAIVTAAAGSGKSRLRRDVMHAAARGGVKNILLRFDPSSSDSPLAELGRAFASDVNALDTVQRALIRNAARLPLSDDDANALSKLDSQEAHDDATLGAFASAVRGIAAAGGVLIVLEDVHWADAATLRLIDRLVVEDELAVAVVAFARPDLFERFEQLWSRRSPMRIELPPLTRRSVETLAKAIAPSASREQIDRIVDHAGGSPLVVEELSRQLLLTGRVEASATARAVFDAQFAKLSDVERLVLRASAVVGERFSTACVVMMLEGVVDAQRTIDGLVERDLLLRERSSSDLRFRHALLRDAAHGASSPDALAALNRGAAHWYQCAREHDALAIARHADAGGLLDVAARAYEQAALMAGDDPQVACGLFERALALLPAPSEARTRLLAALEEIYRNQGRQLRRLRALAALRRFARGGEALSAEARIARYRYEQSGGMAATYAIDVAQRAGAVGLNDVAADALATAALAFRDSTTPLQGIKPLQDALAGVAASASPRARAELHRVLGILYRRSGDPAAALAEHSKAVKLVENDPTRSVLTLCSLGFLQLSQGYLAKSRASFQTAYDTLLRFHLERNRARILGNFANVAIVAGNPSDAIRYATDALTLHERGLDTDVHVESACMIVHALADRGDFEAAQAALDRAVAVGSRSPTAYDAAHCGWLQGRLLLQRSRDHEAVAVFERALGGARESGHRPFAAVLAAELVRAKLRVHEPAESLTEAARLALNELVEPACSDFSVEGMEALSEIDARAPIRGLHEAAVVWLATRRERIGDELLSAGFEARGEVQRLTARLVTVREKLVTS